MKQVIAVAEQLDLAEKIRNWAAREYQKKKICYERGDGQMAMMTPWAFWEIYREGRLINHDARQILLNADELAKRIREHQRGRWPTEQWQYALLGDGHPLDFARQSQLLNNRIDDHQCVIFFLALTAWSLDHQGSFPETLQQLDGEYWKQIPARYQDFEMSPKVIESVKVMFWPAKRFESITKETQEK